MPKSRNMSHKSHHAQDAELSQNVHGLEDELGDQPPGHLSPTKASGEAPPRRHSH